MTDRLDRPHDQIKLFEQISNRCFEARQSILRAIVTARSGHVGGSFSAVEILTVLATITGRFDQTPSGQIILSKGHGCPALYAVLAFSGAISKQSFEQHYRRIGYPFKGHPDLDAIPETGFNSNSLGLGVAAAVGYALGYRLKRSKERVYVVVGDGEYREGIVQEALMFAAEQGLGNLVVIVDNNHIQMSETTDIIWLRPDTIGYGSPLVAVQFCDGHSIPALYRTFTQLADDRLNLIICETIKGAGISRYEGDLRFHGSAPSPTELEQGLDELRRRRTENLNER